jgi:RNA polymerase sigma-70 factor (family 1)
MQHTDTEREIIKRFREGHEKAMDPIFKLYHKSLLYFGRQLVDNDGQAEDIVADAFIKLWQKNTDFENLASIRAFMYVTIRNSCCNYLKHVQRKTASHQKILHSTEKSEDFIESKMIKANLMQFVLQEIENLPPIRRKIFKMLYFDDMSVNEVCAKLDITDDTVRVQKARALHTLRGVMKKFS